MANSAPSPLDAPSDRLAALSKQALEISKKAKKHNKSLGGDNHYGNKLAAIRSEATNAYTDLQANSAGDATALAELIDSIFAPSTPQKTRTDAVRQLNHALATTWRNSQPPATTAQEFLFPPTILAETKRSYIVSVGHQMNGCFTAGHMDACAVMMRRLLEIALIEAFEQNGIADKIKDDKGDYVMLTKLIEITLKEPKFALSRTTKRELPRLKDLGHRSAHGRYHRARREDLQELRDPIRVVIEEFLVLAKLT